MAYVKCVQIRRDIYNDITKRRFITPKTATVNRQGSRGVDNAQFTFDPKTDVEEGDEMYYIQDVTDVEHLKGMWNFNGSFRDESGYHNDDFIGTPYAFPVGSSLATISSGKYKGKHKMKVRAKDNNVGVRIPNINAVGSGVPILDFSTDFDIFFEIKSNTYYYFNTATIFDKYNTVTGQGIRISINKSAETISVLMGNGSTTTTQTTPAIDGFDLTNLSTIRVGRQGDQVYIWHNDRLIDTDTYAGDLATTDDLYLFTTAAPAEGFSGFMYQLRIYDKYLSATQATKIWRAKPQTMTMKFGGKVWKIEDSGTSKKVICNGFGAILLNTQVTSTLLTGTKTFTNGSERHTNVFVPNPTNLTKEISTDNLFTEIVAAIGTTDEYIINLEKDLSFDGGFVAEGSFIDIINVALNVGSTTAVERTFNVSPRKVIIVDKIQTVNNIITTSNFRLLNTGEDTTTLTNNVIAIGRGEINTVVQTSGLTTVSLVDIAFSTGYEMKGLESFEAYPITIISVTSDDGGGTTYTQALDELDTGDIYYYDKGANRIKFRKASGSTTAAFTLHFSYKYEESFATNLIQIDEDPDSITVNGLYSSKINVPQLMYGVDVDRYCDRVLDFRKEPKPRVRAESRALINSLAEGEQVNVFYAERGIGSQDSTTFAITTEPLVVRSIKYQYPHTLTTIELGEHSFDSFDLEATAAQSVRQIASGSNESSI